MGERMILAAQSSDATAGNATSGGDLVSEVGNDIRVALDRWSVGQLEVADLLAAAAVLTAGAVIAWLASRASRRIARRTTGAARASIAMFGLLAGGAVALLAFALALEMLGFSIGPILIIVLVAVVALQLLRPLITNLSSGLLLQMRGALKANDLVEANGVLGVVNEINARSVVLDTGDGRRVHVPNSDVLNDAIENYTARGRRRSSFDVMVACDTDIDGVTATVLGALQPVDAVFDDPPPEAQVAGIAGRLVVVRVYVWHAPPMAAQRAAVDRAARAVLAAAGPSTFALDGPEWMATDTLSRPREASGARDHG